MKTLQTFLAIVFFAQSSLAQSSLKLPIENKDLAKEKYAILSDSYESNDEAVLQQAYEAFQWIAENAPDLHETAYILGQKTLRKMIETDPNNQDFPKILMDVYDMRMEHFGSKEEVLHRKAFDAYKYLRADSSYLNEATKVFKGLFEQMKDNIPLNLAYSYFDLLCRQYSYQLISEHDLIEAYYLLSKALFNQSNTDSSKISKIQTTIDSRLIQTISVDCNSIGKLKKYEIAEDRLTLSQARLIIKVSLLSQCQKHPLFYESLDIVFEHNPTFKIAKLLSAYELSKNDSKKAMQYLNQAQDMASSDLERSAVFYEMAKIHHLNGQKAEAREMAQEALTHNPSFRQCHSLIGDLYYSSYDECKKGRSRVLDRSVFYAAYQQYVLADDKIGISNASMQFPSIEDIHTENYLEGQWINTGCWLKESVKVMRRPN
jgi:tetratricopeptide (TPR) repeat protein